MLRAVVIQPVYVLHLYKMAHDPVTIRLFRQQIVFFLVYCTIGAASYALGWGLELLLLWILPAHIGLTMCPLFFDWPVHHPHSDRGRYTDSAILLFPKPIRFLVEFFFCGHCYHLMHHLYPRLPFYHYGTAYYALESELRMVGAKIRNF